jgi:hypothetical protein
LLVEPQRTNLARWSSSFDNAEWNKEDISISTNASISPSGIQDADKLIPNTNNIDHTIYEVITGSASRTFSVYAKADGYNYIFLGSNNNSATDGVFFNLTYGTISQNTSGLTASIEDAGNGWYRCIVSSSSWPTIYAIICSSANGTSIIHTGNGTSGILLWGAQFEAGNYSTSYIPTTSASVTRNADVISKTGISSLIGQTEGAFFAELTFQSGSIPIFIGSSVSGSAGEATYIEFDGSFVVAWIYKGGVLQAQLHRTSDDVSAHAFSGSRIRLCKGAYAEGPEVAFVERAEIDKAYVRDMRTLLESAAYPMLATHDPRLIEIGQALALRTGRAKDSFEFQMLLGVRPEEQKRLVELGYKVRVYVPYGDEWYGYLMRRMAEKPSNLALFVKSLASKS